MKIFRVISKFCSYPVNCYNLISCEKSSHKKQKQNKTQPYFFVLFYKLWVKWGGGGLRISGNLLVYMNCPENEKEIELYIFKLQSYDLYTLLIHQISHHFDVSTSPPPGPALVMSSYFFHFHVSLPVRCDTCKFISFQPKPIQACTKNFQHTVSSFSGQQERRYYHQTTGYHGKHGVALTCHNNCP